MSKDFDIMPNVTAESAQLVVDLDEQKIRLAMDAVAMLEFLHKRCDLKGMLQRAAKNGLADEDIVEQCYGTDEDTRGVPEANGRTVPEIIDKVRELDERILATLAGR